MGIQIRHLIVVTAAAATAGFTVVLNEGSFAMDPKGAAHIGYFPTPLKLSDVKPAQVKREPAYRTSPKYGIIKLGNGPRNEFVVALDEPWSADWKIYIDKNQNGDLTDDGDGAWNKKTESRGRTQYGVLDVTLRASYGDSRYESSSAPYSVGIYRFSGTPAPFMYRESTRIGEVTIDGKAHKAMLAENDADALFNKPVKTVAEGGKARPVWLMVDLNDDGKWSSGQIDARAPFKLGDKVYEAFISEDGSKVDVHPTTKAAVDLAPKREPAVALLKSGSAAPDFSCEKWGGGSLKLSDYKGKIVILDFWATWCGPCQASMPHVEKISKAVGSQGVVVLGVCVWDEKAAYTEWMPKNQDKYSFQFAFDPAAANNAASIATKLFKVSGIPTTYIIDKDGNVADAIVGYGDGDTRLEAALKKLGVKLD